MSQSQHYHTNYILTFLTYHLTHYKKQQQYSSCRRSIMPTQHFGTNIDRGVIR